jgi:hypothetical protein
MVSVPPSSAEPRVFTVASYLHYFYGERLRQSVGRFPDTPAKRGFAAYQLRLVNALISRAKGFSTEEPEIVIRLNPYLIEEDFDDLFVVLDNLAKHALVDSSFIDDAKLQLIELQKNFASIRNRSQPR